MAEIRIENNTIIYTHEEFVIKTRLRCINCHPLPNQIRDVLSTAREIEAALRNGIELGNITDNKKVQE